MDVEFARMRERLETMNLILDDIQVRFFLNKLVCNRRRQSRIANQYQEFSVYLFYVLTKLAQIQQYKNGPSNRMKINDLPYGISWNTSGTKTRF